MILDNDFHVPVLLPQVLAGLKIHSNCRYIDATLGGGGYTFEILIKGGIVLGIDRDVAAISYVKQKIINQKFKVRLGKEITLEHGNFADLKKIAWKNGFEKVAGVIFDLGVSSFQIKNAGRGFTFQNDEPLDMRMDERTELKAVNILNNYSSKELYEIFSKFGEELNSRPIAEAIFRARTLDGSIKTTRQLVEIINKTIGNDKYSLRVVARIFQALRIVVNEETDNLRNGLLQAVELLEKNGRLVVLSYHSLEDRIVKLFFEKAEINGTMRIITKQPIRADFYEVKNNSSSRPAKLRIAEKIYGKL